MKVREEFRNIFFETGCVTVGFFAIAPGLGLALTRRGFSVSPRCRPTVSSSLLSGASTRSTSRNNTRHEKCRTLSTSRVSSPAKACLPLEALLKTDRFPLAINRACDGPGLPGRLLRARQDGARDRRLRFDRLPVSVLARRDVEAGPPDTHDLGLVGDAVRAREPTRWLQAGQDVLDRPRVPE